MKMYTVHADLSIDPWILGKLRRERDGSVLADLFVRDLDEEMVQIGSPMVPMIRNKDEEFSQDLIPISHGHSMHSACILFIHESPMYPSRHFTPLLQKLAFCCGERLSVITDNILALLWFLDQQGWIFFNGLVYTLAPSGLLMPVKI